MLNRILTLLLRLKVSSYTARKIAKEAVTKNLHGSSLLNLINKYKQAKTGGRKPFSTKMDYAFNFMFGKRRYQTSNFGRTYLAYRMPTRAKRG